MNNSIYYFQNVKYKFSISPELQNLNYYIIMKSKQHDSTYATSCESWNGNNLMNTSISKFGWKTQDESGNDHLIEANNDYDYSLLWAPMDDFVQLMLYNDSYEFMHLINFPMNIFMSNSSMMNDTYPPVIITTMNHDHDLSIDNNQQITWNFTSSYSIGSIINFYFMQNNSILNNSYNITYDNDNGVNYQFITPNNLIVNDNNYPLYIITSTSSCSNTTWLTSTINATAINGGGGSNNNLSAGAIVGIVVAGVVVIGVAAWWLCMRRKGSSDGGKSYQPLEE